MGVQALKSHSKSTKYAKASTLVAPSAYNIFQKQHKQKLILRIQLLKFQIMVMDSQLLRKVQLTVIRWEMQGSQKYYGSLSQFYHIIQKLWWIKWFISEDVP